jgi:phage terminase large subunit GpA-like protein
VGGVSTEIVRAEMAGLLRHRTSGWAPPPKLSVSEWAELKRMLPETSAAKGGPWRNAIAPYLVGIMDACRCSRDDGNRDVTGVAVLKSAQSGGSSAIENVIGYHIEHDPCAILMIHQTDSAGREWVKERFEDMVRSTPALSARVRDMKPPRGSHLPESTLQHKLFPGGQLFVAGAGSPNAYARRAARLVIADDYARFPAEVKEEGDPGELLKGRITTFHDGLLIYNSTPTVRRDRIDSLWLRSDQRRYFLRCPRCGHEDFLLWSGKLPLYSGEEKEPRHEVLHFRVAYSDDNAQTARVECPRCKAAHDETTRRRMVAEAPGWKATRPADDRGLAGFHLPATIATLGNTSLSDLVSGWLSAQKRGRESLKGFINTKLAEPWDEPDTAIRLEPAGGFLERRERYDVVPMEASLITGAMDVQDDRFELLFCAWGERDEMWVLEHVVFAKDDPEPERCYDPYSAQDWGRLYAALYGQPGAEAGLQFEHASGKTLPVSTFCVDSGYQTAHAYRFSRFNRQAIFATKGVDSLADGHLIKWSSDRETATRAGLRLLLVNTGAIKERLLDRIADGRVHFPVAEWASKEFFEQLTAEEMKPVFNPAGVRVGQKWVKKRARNEILDLVVLNIAARQIRGTLDLAAYRRQVGLP